MGRKGHLSSTQKAGTDFRSARGHVVLASGKYGPRFQFFSIARKIEKARFVNSELWRAVRVTEDMFEEKLAVNDKTQLR